MISFKELAREVRIMRDLQSRYRYVGTASFQSHVLLQEQKVDDMLAEIERQEVADRTLFITFE